MACEKGPQVIALCGDIGCGKDTLADHLVNNYGYYRLGFSDPVYQGLYALDPYIQHEMGTHRLSHILELLSWDRAKREYPEIRRLLRFYGTEAGRNIHGWDCWIKLADKVIQKQPKVVIRDLRFENELDLIRSYGGYVIYIDRPRVTAGLPVPGDKTHASEQLNYAAIANYTYRNDGTIEDMHAWFDTIAPNLFSPSHQEPVNGTIS